MAREGSDGSGGGGVRVAETAPPGQALDDARVRGALRRGLADLCAGERVLVLVPDHTRTLPLPLLFRAAAAALEGAAAVTVMVALGTHPPLSEARLDALVGADADERERLLPGGRLVNHAWQDDDALVEIGALSEATVRAIAGERWHETLAGRVPVRINRAALEHDRIVILGPTFPHEVVGFSGGAKYLFPGISGPEMIDATHWLGALAGVRGTIGLRDTPVRAMIHAAADLVPTPVTLAALTVEGDALTGIHVGDHVDAWRAAADLSSERHIRWVERPFERILSKAPPMYDELWTAGKAMYKLEPALAAGGELIIWAPHLDTVSRVHGEHIREVGYHVLPWILENWERLQHLPLGVLAHSTHVRGDGRVVDGVERPRATVTLASRIPEDECRRLSLGYRDPDTIDPEAWAGREDEGVLFVPKAGEMLYRVREPAAAGAAR